MVNLDSLFGSDSDGDRILEPRRIFTTLNRDPRFKRPSDEQGEVLDQWFDRRSESDVTIKMNTGAGKTLVGLLILKSSLAEGKAPAVYLTPDKYLAKQVIKEARELGIPVTDSEDDPSFLRGEAIFVANSKKVINGKSRFGVNDLEIPIGSIVVDDAHACLTDVKEQFSINLPLNHAAAAGVMAHLKDGLRSYNPILYSRIEQNDPSAIFEVPYWIWKSKTPDIASVIIKNSKDGSLQFHAPLVLPVLSFCQCVVTGQDITISPRYLPIHLIPSFTSAERRIYMTATLANDGILISHLKANVAAIENPIRPKGIGDTGVRMILAPMELNKDFIFEQLKALALKVAKERNVVVITPSNYVAKKWKPFANQFLDATNLYEGVERLRNGLVGLTVMANKYDGIDLPGEACELLILDGAPEIEGEIEKLNSLALEGTKSSRINTVQKIEQGMGRGVRSADDFCAVLLWGPKLTRIINLPNSLEHFTEVTKVQLSIARRLTRQMNATGELYDEDKIISVLDLSFKKNPDWRQGTKKEIAKAQPERKSYIEPFIPRARKAFDLALSGAYDKACDQLQEAANEEQDERTQGYILCQLAEMMYHRDPLESFKILARASLLNPAIIKPLEGLEYKRISAPENQAVASCRFMSRFMSGDDLILWWKDLESDLAFNPQTTKRFEAAIRELGAWLGFGSHRPENETGKGPDNLWAVDNSTFFVIECKSGSLSDDVSKSDLNQLNGSVHWFGEKYPPGNVCLPILVHKKHTCVTEAAPHPDARVIDEGAMAQLLENCDRFARAISTSQALDNPVVIRDQLAHFGFTKQRFLDKYTLSIRKRS